MSQKLFWYIDVTFLDILAEKKIDSIKILKIILLKVYMLVDFMTFIIFGPQFFQT